MNIKEIVSLLLFLLVGVLPNVLVEYLIIQFPSPIEGSHIFLKFLVLPVGIYLSYKLMKIFG